MANHTTKAERQELVDYAAGRIRLDGDMVCTNYHAVQDELMARFGVTKQRAQSATAKACRQKRGEIIRNRK